MVIKTCSNSLLEPVKNPKQGVSKLLNLPDILEVTDEQKAVGEQHSCAWKLGPKNAVPEPRRSPSQQEVIQC